MMRAPLDQIRAFTVGDYTYDGKYIAHTFTSSGDLKRDHDDNDGWIAYWGYVTAEAKREHDLVEAKYRVARDEFIYECFMGVAVDENGDARPKTNKTNAEVVWRTTPGYASWYEKISEAERAWSTAQFIYDAAQTRARSLGSMTKHQLDEQFASRVG